jgi:hypothetical protein
MSVQCMYNAIVQPLTDMVCTDIEIHKHVYTCMYIFIHVHTCMNMVCTWCCSDVYVLDSDVYVHVYTCMYMF